MGISHWFQFWYLSLLTFKHFNLTKQGIGKEIAWKLANQGLNLVLVALDDEIFEKTIQELNGIFKDIEIRKVLIIYNIQSVYQMYI